MTKLLNNQRFLKYTDMKIIKTDKSRLRAEDLENPSFGVLFSDHMYSMEYRAGKWTDEQVMPFGKIEVSPAMTTLHYGQAIFEGMKAFCAADGRINIFRPDKYHARMNRSAHRLCIPEIDYETFITGLAELLRLDKPWVPRKRGFSLYLRPFIFATDSFLGVRVSDTYRFLIITSPVGAYYKEGLNPVSLVTPGDYARSARGGLGAAKTPANYAASLLPTEEAHRAGFTQVLWLDASEKRYIEEVGTMNIFFLIGDELITPSLEGSVLAGVTRDTVIELAKDWGVKITERPITIDEVFSASANGTLKEVFGTGTAAVISPVGIIEHIGKRIIINDNKTGVLSKRLYDTITGIQYCELPDKFGWCHRID